MNEEIRKLLELQDCDVKIIRLKQERLAARELLERERKRIREAAEVLNEDTKQSKALAARTASFELDLKSWEEKIARLSEQQATVKTNKEYAAFQKEIASAEADKSLIEDELLSLYEAMDAYKAEKERARVAHSEQSTRVAELERETAAREMRFQEEIRLLAEERSRLEEGIAREYLDDYTRIARRVGGMALAKVVRYSAENDVYNCQGCNMNIPANVLTQVLRAEGPTHCQNCSRILYVNEVDQETEIA